MVRSMESFSRQTENENPLENGYVLVNGTCCPKTSNEPALRSILQLTAQNTDTNQSCSQRICTHIVSTLFLKNRCKIKRNLVGWKKVALLPRMIVNYF